jgi:quinohemoprotein ethanol dehydrogenase
VKNPGKAQMRALDPLTGKTVWAADTQSWQDRGGALVTAGGVMVHGNVAGQLVVRDAANGRIVKTIDTGTSILAAPMTYTIGKTQYIAVAAGWGGGFPSCRVLPPPIIG